ncbi:MAG: hypothetical protein ACTSPD_20615, partial [Promethearchaeota archaeon]
QNAYPFAVPLPRIAYPFAVALPRIAYPFAVPLPRIDGCYAQLFGRYLHFSNYITKLNLA